MAKKYPDFFEAGSQTDNINKIGAQNHEEAQAMNDAKKQAKVDEFEGTLIGMLPSK